MRIVILSDTHGLLRPEVLAALEGADAIVHGGDINTQAVVDTLEPYAPLRIVRGNNDKEWAEGLPHELRFTLAGVRFYQTCRKAPAFRHGDVRHSLLFRFMDFSLHYIAGCCIMLNII